MFVLLLSNIVRGGRGQAYSIGSSLCKSPKVHVDCAKHGVTEDLMVARLAGVHWQR